MNPASRNRYELAVEVTRQAGQLALKHFEAGVTVERKGDDSPVTVADRAAEKLLRDQLLARFPNDGFLGEEYGEKPGDSGFRWVVDPIDGTRSFVRGIPLWGTIVALEYKGEAVAGVVMMPALGGQLYRALRGDGAYRDHAKINVSAADELGQAICLFSNLVYFEKYGKREAFLRLLSRVERDRGFGDVYGFLLVAQGSAELMIDLGVHIWDVAGVVPIVEEAGGRVTNWDGGLDLNRHDMVASNGKLHGPCLDALNGR